MKKKKFLKRSVSHVELLTPLLGVAGTLALALADARAESTTFYRETYQYCTSSLGKPAAAEAGWFALVSGLPKEKFGNLKVFSYGSTLIGSAVNSFPHGKSQGYSFWFKPTYGLSVLTSEFTFDVGLLSKYPSSVEYEQRLSGMDAAGALNQTQLIFLIDNDWYISGTAARQAKVGSWEPVKVDPSQLLYGKVPYLTGLGATTPTAYDNSLPLTGAVRAFGVFVGEVNGRVRVDNFTLRTSGPIPSGISTAIQATTVEDCPLSSPDVTGAPVPTPTPDPEDKEDGIDRGTPPPANVTPAPTPLTHPASFCSTREQGSGLRIRVRRANQRAFISHGLARGIVGARDRALAHLYAARVMPVGALVNVRVGDYNKKTGVLKLSLTRGKAATAIKLTPSVRSSLNRYIASLGGKVRATDPLFGAVAKGRKTLNTKKAVCSAELRALVIQRARAARITLSKLFVR